MCINQGMSSVNTGFTGLIGMKNTGLVLFKITMGYKSKINIVKTHMWN